MADLPFNPLLDGGVDARPIPRDPPPEHPPLYPPAALPLEVKSPGADPGNKFPAGNHHDNFNHSTYISDSSQITGGDDTPTTAVAGNATMADTLPTGALDPNAGVEDPNAPADDIAGSIG
jgi:hypothetical protein